MTTGQTLEAQRQDDLAIGSLSDDMTVASPWGGFRRRFRSQRPAVIALSFLVLMAGVALAAPWLAPSEPNAQALGNNLQGPSGEHLLGTDELGRDVLTRLLYAARVSLLAALQAVAVAFVLGVPVGLLAGFYRGWVDAVVMRMSDTLMSFPPLLLAIAIVGVLGTGLTNAMIAVGLVYAPRFARLLRASVLEIREETYVEAARSIGVRSPTIIVRHILPNIVAPVIVWISLAAGFAMLAEASLSFIGLGVQPPEASWGSMLEEGARHLSRSATLVVFPGLAIGLTVLAFNVLGDGIRDSIGREERKI